MYRRVSNSSNAAHSFIRDLRDHLITLLQRFYSDYYYFILISIIYRSLGTLPPGAASRWQSQALMKRGGQMTLSLGGSMRLVPASRSPLAVPAATGQPDAEG